jgi:hypothetical protein
LSLCEVLRPIPDLRAVSLCSTVLVQDTQSLFGVRATDASHHASHRSLALAQWQSDDDTDNKRAPISADRRASA